MGCFLGLPFRIFLTDSSEIPNRCPAATLAALSERNSGPRSMQNSRQRPRVAESIRLAMSFPPSPTTTRPGAGLDVEYRLRRPTRCHKILYQYP